MCIHIYGRGGLSFTVKAPIKAIFYICLFLIVGSIFGIVGLIYLIFGLKTVFLLSFSTQNHAESFEEKKSEACFADRDLSPAGPPGLASKGPDMIQITAFQKISHISGLETTF